MHSLLLRAQTDALGRPTRELEFQLWTKEDFDAAGLKTPLTGMRFKCMVASEWLGEEPGICGLSSVHAKCGNIDNDISPTEYGDSQRAK